MHVLLGHASQTTVVKDDIGVSATAISAVASIGRVIRTGKASLRSRVRILARLGCANLVLIDVHATGDRQDHSESILFYQL